MKLLLQYTLLLAYSTSTVLSKGNTIGGLGLKKDADVEFQTLDSGRITDLDGDSYDLKEMRPHTDLFSSDHYRDKGDGTVVEKLTGRVIPVRVYKHEYPNGATVLASVGQDRKIIKAEIIKPGYVTSLVRDGNEYMTFSSDAVDLDKLNSQYHFGEATVPDDDRRGLRGGGQHELFPVVEQEHRELQCTHRVTSNCNCFKTINIAVVYDNAFCSPYGNKAAAETDIQKIVADASSIYEQDMCVKLKLTRVYSPDGCTSSSSVFQSMNRDDPCDKSDSFLRQFSDHMKNGNQRTAYGIDDATAVVHHFTGHIARGTIGCAWIGTVCNKNWMYGVNYMNWSTNDRLRAVLFAHELGHNIDGRHFSQNNHVMYFAISSATNGFSSTSVNSIVGQLNRVSCDYNEEKVNQAPPDDNDNPGLTLGGTLGGPLP